MLHPSCRIPDAGGLDATVHTDRSGRMWWPNALLIDFTFLVPFFCPRPIVLPRGFILKKTPSSTEYAAIITHIIRDILHMLGRVNTHVIHDILHMIYIHT